MRKKNHANTKWIIATFAALAALVGLLVAIFAFLKKKTELLGDMMDYDDYGFDDDDDCCCDECCCDSHKTDMNQVEHCGCMDCDDTNSAPDAIDAIDVDADADVDDTDYAEIYEEDKNI